MIPLLHAQYDFIYFFAHILPNVNVFFSSLVSLIDAGPEKYNK